MHPHDWLDPGVPLDPARAGAIKGGASYHRITPVRAAAPGGHRRGSRRRPGPRSSSTAEIGTAAHEIVDLLEASGATADRIALAHLDRNPDAELHAEVAARGITLEYDTIGRTKYHPDSVRARPDRARWRAPGTCDRLMLGLDLGARELPSRL